MNLKSSIDNLAKRLDKFDPVFHCSNKFSLSHWKEKPIIPLEEWLSIGETPYVLDYFPDDFDQVLTYISEDELKGEGEREDAKKWNSDYLELMEYTKNSNYGKLKCFHCLLSPAGDDPIFIGINRLVAKGLTNDKSAKHPIQYPCQVVNRFQCPYERTGIKEDDDVRATNSHFDPLVSTAPKCSRTPLFPASTIFILVVMQFQQLLYQQLQGSLFLQIYLSLYSHRRVSSKSVMPSIRIYYYN